MTYEIVLLLLTVAFASVFLLIILTNLLAQLLKKVVNRNEFPAQAIVFIIAEVLTFLAVIIALQIAGIPALWYYWVLTFIAGCLVAYGAIFGYDNLYSQLYTAIKSVIDIIFRKKEE